MSFFSRVQVKKYNPNHGKDGKFSTSDEAGGPKSITDTPDGAHKNLSAYDGILAHIQASIPAAEYAAHSDVLLAAVEHALTFNPDLNSKAKAMFVMNALKEKFAGWGTPSKIIRKFLQTKVPYAHGNTAFAAIHGILVANETGAHHEAPSAHVSENLPAAVAPKAPDVKPVADEVVDVNAELAKPEPKPEPKPAPDLSGKTPLEKFKLVVAHHMGEAAQIKSLPADTWNGVMGATHTAFMQAGDPKSFANKMSEAINDLHAQGKISVEAGAQIAQSGLMGLHDKLHEALGKAPPVAPAAAAAPVPAPAPKAAPLSPGPGYGSSTVASEVLKAGWAPGGPAAKELQNAVDWHVGGALGADDLKQKVVSHLASMVSDVAATQAGKMDWNKIANASMGHYVSGPPKSANIDPVTAFNRVLTETLKGKDKFDGEAMKVVQDAVLTAFHTTDTPADFDHAMTKMADKLAESGKLTHPQASALSWSPWYAAHPLFAEAAKSIDGNAVGLAATGHALNVIAPPKPQETTKLKPAAPVGDFIKDKSTAPKETGDFVHDNVMNVMHFSGNDFTDKEKIVGSNMAKNALPVSDDAPQFEAHVHEAIDTYAKQYAGKIDAEKLKALPWHIVHDESQKSFKAMPGGKVPAVIPYTDEAKVAASFPDKQVTASPAAPAPAPAEPVKTPPAALPKLSAAALDEEVHNQLNQAGYQGQGSAAHPFIAQAAAKAFLASDGSWASFDHKLVDEVTKAKSAGAATAMMKVIDSVKLHAAVQDGTVQTALNDATAKKTTVAYNPAYVDSPGSILDTPTPEKPAPAPYVDNATALSPGQGALASGYKPSPYQIQTALTAGHKLGLYDASKLYPTLDAAVKNNLTVMGLSPGTKAHKIVLQAMMKNIPKSAHGADLKKKTMATIGKKLSDGTKEAIVSAGMWATYNATGQSDLSALKAAAVASAQPASTSAVSAHAASNLPAAVTPKAPEPVKAPFVPTAQHYADKVKEMAKNAGINPYAVEHMGDTAAKVAPFSGSANEFHAKAMEDLDKKVAAGTLKPSPSVDKLKNNIDWKVAFTEAQKDPADKAAAEAAAQATAQAENDKQAAIANAAKKGKGDTSVDGSYPGFRRFDSDNSGLGKAMKQRPLTSAEGDALETYKGSGYGSINAQLRQGKMLSADTLNKVKNLTSAVEAGTVPAGTMLYRGMPDFEEIGFSNLEDAVKHGKGWHDNGFLSCTSARAVGDNWSLGGGGSGPRSVLFEMKITKPVSAVHVGVHQGSDGEKEIVMPPQTLWKVTGVRKGDGMKKWVVTMETV